MKKFISIIIALALSLTLVLSFSACAEVENGVKIQRMKMTLEYTDADGQSVERTVQLKLYLNNAPKTTARFMELAEKGYYNGVCVSNVQTNWVEFGAYKYVDGTLTRADGQLETLKGEFSANGWSGNSLLSNKGALIMKRDYTLDTNTTGVYDSAKSTVIVALGSVSKFPSSQYCVFGVVCSDDEAYTATSASTTKTHPSIDAFSALTELRETSDGVMTYYNEKENAFYATKLDEEGVRRYYLGATIAEDDSNLLEGQAEEQFIKKLDENSTEFLVIPYNTITIKSIVKA